MKNILFMIFLLNVTFITFADIPLKKTNIVTLNISPRFNPTGELWATGCLSLSYLRNYKNFIYFGSTSNMNFHSFLCTFDCALRSNNMDNNILGGEFRIGLGIGKYHYWVNESNYNFYPAISSSLNLELGYGNILFRLGLAIDSDLKINKNSIFAFGPTVGLAFKF